MKWMFLGSSPNAPAHLAAVLPRLGEFRTITANAGIKLMPTPDVYFLADRVACGRYNHLARKAKEHGTHLVTMHRNRSALKERNVEWFDEFLINGVDPPLPNRWSAFNQSGAMCLEYACRHGATEVHVLGCEGYADERSYFDQDERPTDHKISDSETNVMFIKRTTLIVECFKSIPFYAYGTLNYTIPLENWHVRSV